MRLVQVLSIVLTQLSIGSLILVSLIPPRAIRLSFFTLNSLICAVAAALALLLSSMVLRDAWADVRFLGLTVIGSTIAFGCFRLEKPETGRLFLILSGLLGLVLGLLPLAGKTMAARGIRTEAPWFFDAGLLTGALLLGATNVGMILGHWYLLMRRLSFEYLERFAQILLAAVGLRIVAVVATLSMLHTYDPKLASTFIPALWSWQQNLFFFLMRWLWGLALPLVLGVFVLRCVKEKANQAATGLLYVIEVSVLFGELFAAYLMI
jgi:hypothetical protein